MTILLTLWRLITASKLARAIGGAVAALAALWAYGASQRHKGASTARADAAAKAAKQYRDTTERIQHEDASMGDDPAALREWLRQRDTDKR